MAEDSLILSVKRILPCASPSSMLHTDRVCGVERMGWDGIDAPEYSIGNSGPIGFRTCCAIPRF